MKKYLLIMGVLILGTPVHAQDRSTIMKDVTLWYEAFSALRPTATLGAIYATCLVD